MMMQKQDSLLPILPIAKKEICSHCNLEEKLLLHHIRHQGMLRRLCTCCVLLFHSQSFCPTCFLVYDRPPPSSTDFITCSKCYSCSHTHCVVSKPVNSPYVCPLCISPRLHLFNLKKVTLDGDGQICREFDKRSSKVLLAAAKIATANINKAAGALRVESEKRSKEAAVTRKRARETLHHFAGLVVKEKMMKKEHLPATETSAPGNGNNGSNGFNREKNQRLGSISINSAMEHIRMEAANEVSARLNAVGLREKERLQGIGAATGNHERMKTSTSTTSTVCSLIGPRVNNINGKLSIVPPADNNNGKLSIVPPADNNNGKLSIVPPADNNNGKLSIVPPADNNNGKLSIVPPADNNNNNKQQQLESNSKEKNGNVM